MSNKQATVIDRSKVVIGRPKVVTASCLIILLAVIASGFCSAHSQDTNASIDETQARALCPAIANYLANRNKQVADQSATTDNVAQAVEISNTVKAWDSLGLDSAFWMSVESTLTVEEIVLALEVGNSFSTNYGCQAIVKTDSQYFIIRTDRRFHEARAVTTSAEPISSVNVDDITRQLLRRYRLWILTSDFGGSQPGEDQDIGVLTVYTEHGIKTLLVYGLDSPSDPQLARALGFLEGAFAMLERDK